MEIEDIKFGYVACFVDNPNIHEGHFVGFMTEPTKDDFESFVEELDTTEEFGFVGKDYVVLSASPEVVSHFKTQGSLIPQSIEETSMALAPHWLDQIFEVPGKSAHRFAKSERFEDAIMKAVDAYNLSTEFMKNNPDVIGAGPAQHARLAFLKAISEA